MLVLTTGAYEAIIEHATDDVPREAAGIVAGERNGDRSLVTSVHRISNVADAPRVSYELDPTEQYETMQTIESMGKSILGFYHSHPAGPPGPSRRDRAAATWPDRYYLIVSLARRPPVLDAWVWDGTSFRREVVTVESAAETE
ncbi:MAG: desampylase [Halanaeroarchaeum sp.]